MPKLFSFKKLFKKDNKKVDPKIHNNIIKKIAKKILEPQGLRQNGNSRTFIYDNNWWIIIVEFQPSGYNRGTYLNIGSCFLIYERDYFAFEYGYRQNDLIKFENEEQFTKECIKLSNFAIEKVEECKKMFPSIKKAYEKVLNEELIEPNPNIYSLYNGAVLSGLVGDIKTAEKCFHSLENYEAKSNWQFKIKNISKKLHYKLYDSKTFEKEIIKIVMNTRKLLKLENKKISFN